MNVINPKTLFIDIETTGLSPDVSAITVIGCCQTDGTITQWFNEDGLSQKKILLRFLDFCSSFQKLVTFNGTTFDMPFIKAKIKEWKIEDSLKQMEHIDLYQKLRPYRHLLPLKTFRQKDFEHYFGISRKDNLSGKALVKLYQTFLETNNAKYKEQLLFHNKEDLTGLLKISSLLCYPALKEGEFSIKNCQLTKDFLNINITLDHSWTQSVIFEKNQMSLDIQSCHGKLFCPLKNGMLFHYYPNPKDYYYLPEEDIILPKNMGSMVDKSSRIPADADHCYSKFKPKDTFLSNQDELFTFCKHNIYYLLRKDTR